jgi:hypothetical protein
MFNGKIHYKWQFSIAMLNYQRVTNPEEKEWKNGDVLTNLTSLPSYGCIQSWLCPPLFQRMDPCNVQRVWAKITTATPFLYLFDIRVHIQGPVEQV